MIRRVAAAVIVVICLGAPVVEMFDQWDHTLQDGNDTEANVAVVALTVGLAIAVGTIMLIATIQAPSLVRSRHPVAAVRLLSLTTDAFVSPIPTVSPPAPLRI